ncbi:synaptotagmin-11-like isoform X2 [Xenia sp. Carnegie-2017]|uniref:synaptotagmin-11-like isoform X2 n=1 Tax=Xenia sp. Carnegie-2017 TaxID=2897299 RepID=UPI001F046B7E|nr:synaptotagmin-11-like isoform X2 [Xenia sp. Carnegie-2017]
MKAILIVSGVLGSVCIVLLIILLYLVRAVRHGKNQSYRREKRLPPGIIVQDNVDEFLPSTTTHRVQSPFSSPHAVSAEHLDHRYYGPDMSKFFGDKYEGPRHYASTMSLEYLNTPIGSPAVKIQHRKLTARRSCPSSPTSPFSERLRGHSVLVPQKTRLKRSGTCSSSSEMIGRLEFTYYYDNRNRQLHVNVIQALGLPGDKNLESYVIVTLKPDEMSWQRETKFVSNSTDPLYNETFLVSGVAHSKIRECFLHFLVMNNGENKAIGQLQIPLADVQPNRITSKCISLLPVISDDLTDSVLSETNGQGEVLVSLSHNPSEGKLSVSIKSVRGLPGITKNGKIDPFIKIRVFFCGERIYNKKTSVQHDTKTPNFDETFDFVVTKDKMPQTSVILRVYHHKRRMNVLNKNVLIGLVFLGYQFELFGQHPFMLDSGARHWATVIEKPLLSVEEWHPIQALPE